MSADIEIDYEAALREHTSRLGTELRGLCGISGLHTWVPAEDVVRGLHELLEAATLEGARSVAVRLPAARAAKLSDAQWCALGAEFGVATFTRGAKSSLLRVELESQRGACVSTLADPPRERARRASFAPRRLRAPLRLPLCFATRVRQAAGRPRRHALELPCGAGAIVRSEVAGWVLVGRVVDGIAVLLTHSGAADELELGVLELACSVGEGRPVSDLADHGAIATLDAAREPLAARPELGVPQPSNEGELFARLERLFRAFDAACQETVDPAAHDRWEPSPRPEWLALPPDARLARLRAALQLACRRVGLDEHAATVVELRGPSRLLVDVDPRLPATRRREALLALEYELADEVEPTLSLERRARTDKSSIRRLTLSSADDDAESE